MQSNMATGYCYNNNILVNVVRIKRKKKDKSPPGFNHNT